MEVLKAWLSSVRTVALAASLAFLANTAAQAESVIQWWDGMWAIVQAMNGVREDTKVKLIEYLKQYEEERVNPIILACIDGSVTECDDILTTIIETKMLEEKDRAQKNEIKQKTIALIALEEAALKEEGLLLESTKYAEIVTWINQLAQFFSGDFNWDIKKYPIAKKMIDWDLITSDASLKEFITYSYNRFKTGIPLTWADWKMLLDFMDSYLSKFDEVISTYGKAVNERQMNLPPNMKELWEQVITSQRELRKQLLLVRHSMEEILKKLASSQRDSWNKTA